MWRALIFFFAGAFAVCPKYSCHSGGFDIGSTCAYPTTTNDIQMQLCDNNNLNSICQITPTITSNFTCGAFQPQEVDPNYPGEFCHSSTQCLSGQCTSNKCVGSSLGGYCVSHADCNVGLYCNQANHCVKQVQIAAFCNSDWDCQNNMACNRTLYNSGVCVPYYSVPNGDAIGMCVTHMSEGLSNLCESGFCIQQKPNTNGEGWCQTAPSTVGKFPSRCNADSDCLGSNAKNSTFMGTCSCGMNKEGEAYCNSWSGDAPAQAVKAIWINHVTSVGIANCHTQRRFTKFCLSQTQIPQQIVNFTQNNLVSANTARYEKNDVCTQVIFNKDYWNVTPDNFKCKAYGCDLKNSWTTDVCITYQESVNKFAVKECTAKNEACNVAQSTGHEWANATCGPVAAKAPLLPGQLCTSNNQCISNNCLSGKCRGAVQGAQCNDDDDCNYGLYCYSINFVFQCVPLIPIGQQGCATDYDCVTNAGCNATQEYPINECVQYYSVPLGGIVPCPISGNSHLCESAACFNNGIDDRGTCVPAPKSAKFGSTCLTSNDCVATNSLNQTFVGQCQCGYNLQGYKYCSAFPGDAPGEKFSSNVVSLYKLSMFSMCHTSLRFSTDCFDMVSSMTGKNADIYFSAYLNYTNFPMYVENDECVRKVFTSNFWSRLPPGPSPKPPGPDNDESGAQMIALVMSLLTLFF